MENNFIDSSDIIGNRKVIIEKLNWYQIAEKYANSKIGEKIIFFLNKDGKITWTVENGYYNIDLIVGKLIVYPNKIDKLFEEDFFKTDLKKIKTSLYNRILPEIKENIRKYTGENYDKQLKEKL